MMKTKRILTALMLSAFFAVFLALCTLSAPAPVMVGDMASEGFLSGDVMYLLSDDGVLIDIGNKASESNVRYAEIDGVQTEITENGNKYHVSVSDKNLLVEITEKTDRNPSSVVRTQYFYVDTAKNVKRLSLDSYVDTYNETSLRVRSSVGIRFKSRILNSAKNENTSYVIDEYGYIVALADNLGSDELTLDFPKHVKGVGYNREKGINIVYDSSDDSYDVFTGVLKNVPVDNYDKNLTCKTYTKITVGEDNFTVYGEPITDSVLSTAKKGFSVNYANTSPCCR